MDEIKVDHPKFGHVIFTRMTGRQKDILNDYQKIVNIEKEKSNDQDFGKEIRKVIKK